MMALLVYYHTKSGRREVIAADVVNIGGVWFRQLARLPEIVATQVIEADASIVRNFR